MSDMKPWYKIPRNIILSVIVVLALADMYVFGMIFGSRSMRDLIASVIGSSIIYVLIAYAIWIVVLKKKEGYRSVLIMSAIVVATLQFTIPKLNEYRKTRTFADDTALLAGKVVKGEEIPLKLLKPKGGDDLSIYTGKVAEQTKIYTDQLDKLRSTMMLCYPERLAADGLLSNSKLINNALDRIVSARNEIGKVREATRKYAQNMRINIQLYMPQEMKADAIAEMDRSGGEDGIVEGVDVQLRLHEKQLSLISKMLELLKNNAEAYTLSNDGRLIFQEQKVLDKFNRINVELIATGKQLDEMKRAITKEANVKIDQLKNN